MRGTGDVRFAAWVGILTAWVVTPPIAWVFGRMLGLGAVGGWFGLSLEICACAAILWWRVERDGWHEAAKHYQARAHALAA